ncbi:hypothetical protein WKI65_41295 [Streptomyces sp. MS1.AVA.3]|uniref:hypothetical protein n=1 Tax=Streptomyces decoyicus TaxID=249567 RepID=UPI0030C0DE48
MRWWTAVPADADGYLCGPPAFMDALGGYLRDHGLRPQGLLQGPRHGCRARAGRVSGLWLITGDVMGTPRR